MELVSRLKNAWSALWGNTDGWAPVASDGKVSTAALGGDERWMAIAAYFACIRNIAEDVAKLPLITYRRMDRGKERAKDHSLYNLLKVRAHPQIGSIGLRETVMRYALGWGNGYAEILRTNSGVVWGLQPLHPQFVKPKPAPKGEVVYEYKPNENDSRDIQAADILHIHGISSDGIRGLSVAGFARETLEFANSSQTYGANIFNRGGRPGGIITHPGKLQKEAKDNLRESWEKAYGGANTGRTAVLDHGVDYKPITISPVDAQFLETRQFSVEEIARWFRMPLHKIQYLLRAQGWSTLDAQNTDYLTDTLSPWLNRWETELKIKLFDEGDDYFAEHLVTGLLRGDHRSRSEYYTRMFSIGVLSINEIRSMENLNPIEEGGGDKHFVPLNMTPAEFADSIVGNKPQEKGENNDAN